MGWQEPQNRPPSFKERCGYAFVGFFSGGILSFVFCFAVGGIVLRISRGRGHVSEYFVFINFILPLILAACMAVWGFIGTKSMTRTLARWWESLAKR